MDLNFSEYSMDEKAYLISHKSLFEKFLQITMTKMIYSEVETREEVIACRKFRDYGIEQLDLFEEEYKMITKKV